MIRPMAKITILSISGESEDTVRKLRDLGMLHVVLRQADNGTDRGSAGVAAQIASVKQAVAILEEYARKPEASGVKSADSSRPDVVVADVIRLSGELKSLVAENTALEEERTAQAPFGDFDPNCVKSLVEKGIPVTLFRVKKSEGTVPAGDFVRILSEDAKTAYGVSFAELQDASGLQKLGLPRYNLSKLDEMIKAGRAAEKADEKALLALVPAAEKIAGYREQLDREFEYKRVAESVENHGRVDDISGFCPYDKVPELKKAAGENGWALWIRDPDETDDVPVDLKLPRWVRPIKVLFTGLGILPGYRETDVSAVFLAFFSVFFAMIICDAGYGALMLAAVMFVRFKKPKADAKPFWLFGLFAVSTIIWGVLTGSYFGMDHSILPKYLQGVPWLSNNSNVMWLCFIIGAVHLTIAHLWNAVAIFPSPKAFAQIGWIGIVWLMFFIAGALVVGRPIPSCVPWIGGIGFLLVVIFMTAPKDFKNEWINHPMLLLNLTSCLVDVISYVRLFAVGMASAQIALIFNQMAVGFALPIWIKPLVMALILILGHGLNLMLGALSILVHAVRLNTLEFSTHKGISWSGQQYAPFRKEKI